ncbi:MAG: PAS domain-containing sensor histidine kinase [Syntrophobacteraceae bacterium]|jgi:PAS domain S-box-containing protein
MSLGLDVEVVNMSDTNIENQLRIANTVEALQESEKRYRRLFESARDGILILDADTGKVVDVNPFLLQLLGYSYDAICGQHIWELGVFKDIAASKDAFKALQDKEYIRYDDLPLETLDGRPIAVEFVSNIYLVDNTKVIQCNIRDITERKRGAALLESEQRVRRLNEHILNMVMVLSHDIRGPLVAIASILKLMLRGVYGKLDQNPANTVQDLLSRCARLLGTAEDYLGKASIVGGTMEMKREVLDLRQDIIDAVLDELADDITMREIVIDNRLGAIPSGSITISANKTWLKAVYRNLFSNAVKYGGGKGSTISFGFEQRESHYRLNVYNSGRPISEEDREKIFDRFERIEPSEGSTPDGVGLGLSLCREIILEHGGEIWYEARPDGSNFVFTISKEDECEA